MAQFNSNGQVKFSGSGLDGLGRSWRELDQTVTQTLPDYRTRLLMVRNGAGGGNNTGHGQKYEDGWFAARTNATVAVEKALGFPHSKPDDVPRSGTKEREGYDAGKAAALLAVLAIHPD